MNGNNDLISPGDPQKMADEIIAHTLRIFPRKTGATPTDDHVLTGNPSIRAIDSIPHDQTHISVTFTYDIPKAEKLAEKIIKHLGGVVNVGGPAYGDRMSDVFYPGVYIKKGYTFTSRGCPNNCWFCSVQKAAHGRVIELPITDGYNILDDNILSTSRPHFERVIEMLKRQQKRPIFTGGIEAKILQPWQAKLMKEAKTQRLYCAYDTPDDFEPLVYAGKVFREAGFTTASHALGCYVLIGYAGDTFEKAESRLNQTIDAGFMPYAMLYRDQTGNVDNTWRKFQREWCRPIIVSNKFRERRHERGQQ